jgi:hypothetical protein
LLGLKRHLALNVLLHSLIRQLSGLLRRLLCRLLSRRWTLEAHGVPLLVVVESPRKVKPTRRGMIAGGDASAL